MKKVLFAFTALFFSVALMAQNAAVKQEKAEDYIKFKDLSHNFGKIKQGVPVTFDFEFTNVGDKPLVIETATPSCGCTTPVWPQAPVAKGKTDKVTAGFNAAGQGAFSKTIKVKLAGVDAPVVLTITGDVLTADEYAKFEKEKSTKKG